MSGTARIDSVDALRMFRTALVKFADLARVALGDAEGEMARVLVSLETEYTTFWSGQIRKRHDAVEKCKDAVRQKKLFKSPSGSTQSAVEEEKQLRIAQKRLEEAEEKLKNVRRYIPRLQKEISIYKGGVQRLATNVSSDIPMAVSRLDKMTQALEAYASLQVSGGGADDSGELFQRMARALGEMEEGGAPPTDYKPLREKTAALDRKAAVPGDVRMESWADGMLTEQERELFTKVDAEKKAPPDQEKVYVEEGAWQSPKIYLERVAPEDGDSGWYVGRADGGEAGARTLAMPLADLFQSRQDLKEITALPVGYLVVLETSGVAAVLDNKGSEIWSAIAK
jgi:hypothetical protein